MSEIELSKACFRVACFLPTKMSFLQVLRRLPVATRSGVRAYSGFNHDLAGLTEDQAELRSVVETFANKEIAPRAAEIDKKNEFPMDLWSVERPALRFEAAVLISG